MSGYFEKMATKSSGQVMAMPLSGQTSHAGTRSSSSRRAVLLMSSVFLAAIFWQFRNLHLTIYSVPNQGPLGIFDGQCPAQPVFSPEARPDITEQNIEKLFKTPEFWNASAKRLSGAIQVPTMSYDSMDPLGVDPRWDVFADLHKYLEGTFSNVYNELEVITINEYGLLYTWPGSDHELKPLLFMAHQDVVPVTNETLKRWTYPPFEGHYDGTYVWGRGAEDDKSNLIAMLSAIDALLNVDFRPSRTVMLAVGFDEEGGAKEGPYGAAGLAKHILEKYGPDSIEFIFDEGVAGLETKFGTEFATPASAEKGHLDISIVVDVEGGHSSTPPDHTAIGFLAELIQTIEKHVFEYRLTSKNPTTAYLSCLASFAPDVPHSLKDAILGHKPSHKVLQFMKGARDSRALVHTSTAVDIVGGGVKSNVLPETAYALINHRVAVEESIKFVKDAYIEFLSPVAKAQNLTLCPFDAKSCKSEGTLGTISPLAHGVLEPSPVSDPKDTRFGWLSGTLRGVFGSDVIVAPMLLTGNTDTRFYWDLSSQIYRFSPWRASLDPRGSRMHTVDERLPVEGLVQMITFYHEFIRVVDEKRT